jgi:lipopolysaccharide export system permease protein
MQFLWKYMDDLVGKGLDGVVILKLLFYASANLVPMALPMAILLASIMTFGNLGENYELVAMKAAGLSLQKIMRPLIYVIVITSITAFVFSNNIWPRANLKMKTLLYDVTHKKPALEIKEKVFYKEIDGFVMRVNSKDKDGQTLYDMTIYDHTDKKKNSKIIRAEKGKMQMTKDERYMVLTLTNGFSYEEMFDKNNKKAEPSILRSFFDEEVIKFDMSSFAFIKSDESLFKDNYEMLNLSQLIDGIDTLKLRLNKRKKDYVKYVDEKLILRKDSIAIKEINTVNYVAEFNESLPSDTNRADSTNFLANNIDYSQLKKDLLTGFSQKEKVKIIKNATNMARNLKSYSNIVGLDYSSHDQRIIRHEIEWHRKFTLSIACLVLFFIGAPLGAIIRKGGLGMPVVISVVFFLIFHVLSITGEKIVKQGELEAFYGMWLATVVLAPIGIFLTLKATSDSPILSTESYMNVLNKIISFTKKSDSDL